MLPRAHSYMEWILEKIKGGLSSGNCRRQRIEARSADPILYLIHSDCHKLFTIGISLALSFVLTCCCWFQHCKFGPRVNKGCGQKWKGGGGGGGGGGSVRP